MSFTAIKALFGMVPAWLYWLLALAILCLGCELHGVGRGAARVQKAWDQHEQQVKNANEAALELRREQNRVRATVQALVSARIQKEHENEMAKVRADLRNSERLRLGVAWCDGASPAGQAKAVGAGGGNEANPSGRVLSEGMDGVVKSLILEMEDVAATGRAAQAFIKENGMAPDASSK